MARQRERTDPPEPASPARQRIDLFIWHARFLRSRSAAADLVRKGHVRVNALRVTQPGHSLKTGDVLTLALPGRTWIVRVEAFSERRGPAEAGLALYTRLDAAMDATSA
ncbi:MAG: RNA-binding protein [Methylobacterium sp.]|nr:MAG: RNA-binding protein [Methylobacterium sp.]